MENSDISVVCFDLDNVITYPRAEISFFLQQKKIKYLQPNRRLLTM